MNKNQKELAEQLLANEEEILIALQNNYAEALRNVKEIIKDLMKSDLSQSKIHQLHYQQNLEKQLEAILNLLASDNINNISDYLEKVYEDSFVGTLYNMQNEGVPFIMAINQDAVIKNISKVTEDFQLSKTLYSNANVLKKVLQNEITRGISQNISYAKIAQKISLHSEADFNKAYRIARTEGGRVECESKFECMKRAKDNGADIVKEWDSSLDSRTRKNHVELDRQIRELDEYFEVAGLKAMHPHGFGIASEDINCRCTVNERARWAVEDDKKYGFTKNIDGDIVEFKDVKDYQDYKKKYFNFYNKDGKIPEVKNNKSDKEEKMLQYIGKLDKNKLGEYKNKVLTEDVVLTDERIKHIQERHPRRI